jgi:hypothetical protein
MPGRNERARETERGNQPRLEARRAARPPRSGSTDARRGSSRGFAETLLDQGSKEFRNAAKALSSCLNPAVRNRAQRAPSSSRASRRKPPCARSRHDARTQRGACAIADERCVGRVAIGELTRPSGTLARSKARRLDRPHRARLTRATAHTLFPTSHRDRRTSRAGGGGVRPTARLVGAVGSRLGDLVHRREHR